MSYPYSLPTTGALSFTDYLETDVPYSSEISDATAQRGRVRTVLKELKKESHSARDYQVIINVIHIKTLKLFFIFCNAFYINRR